MRQPPILPTPTGTSLAGKTIIITGGTSGLGFETSRHFLTLKAARVIITARDQKRGQEAVSALRADPEVKAANPSAVIEAFDLDLEDYQSGLEFSKRVKREVPELDVLVCNGGVNIMNYQKSKSGHERVMQVNCYTHFLISLELLPLLQATAAKRGSASRLNFVGSGTQYHHSLKKTPLSEGENFLAHFDDQRLYSGLTRYSDSKLVVNAFIRCLAEIVPSSEVIVNNSCPGMLSTGFNRNLPLWLKPLVYTMNKMLARTTEDGARTVINASAVAGRETHGRFLQSNAVDTKASFLDGDTGNAFMRRFWKDMVEDLAQVDKTLEHFSHQM
ncbi:hypothetical protein ASPZODRAFT_101429 [Penicilliopsis zonata CBS 506.65]|uniref:Ketoreductase (KR) domain-containing protein n=1 Tax=Penicilliopsis zonata CBS 506.65 TaxID=1073090 RepID=A0A1L9SB51_9EURO|nr:hypothetical protein ASPZODRAFT_101429 [Penicilliopsis zonata CBS 506.65]OJJ44381.1 hypothetical protein ASPZODRAFT_101429 [Penicilliopsis zonata CBS 506.65]